MNPKPIEFKLDEWTYVLNTTLRGEYNRDIGCELNPPEAVPINSKVSTKTFDENDMSEVYHADSDATDEPDFAVVGKLKDGRYFSLRAWHDYTGWD